MKKKKAKLRRIYEEQGTLYKKTEISLIEENGKRKISITNEDGIPLKQIEQIMKIIEQK